MIKKREEKRVPFRKLIVCKCGDDMHPGFIQDVSQHGIGIQTMQRPEPNHRVRIALALGGDSIMLDGQVRWIHEYTGALAAKPREVGVYIPRPPAAFLQLVAECSDHAQPRRSFAYESLK